MPGWVGRVASRVVYAALVVLGATCVLFALTLAIPGNPAQILLGPQATPEAVEAFTRLMGLDRPVWERLGLFLWNAARGEFGTDVISGRPVMALVWEVLPHTLALTAAAMGLAVGLGVPLGCFAALRPGSVLDQAAAVLSVAVIALPSFVVAVVLLLVFSTWLHWLPVLGAGRSGAGDEALRLVLPAVSLAVGWVGYIARLLRASLLDALGEPHARTTRAYGVAERRVVGKYALRLAMAPTLAVLGVGVGQMLGGAVFAEVVFARPGLGTLVYDAISARNYPVVQAAALVVVGLYASVNLCVDAALVWLDPRAAGSAG